MDVFGTDTKAARIREHRKVGSRIGKQSFRGIKKEINLITGSWNPMAGNTWSFGNVRPRMLKG